MAKLKEVLIVGRTNVGKSSLYNRICDLNRAIINKKSGTTRDIHSTEINWRGQNFIINDSGGIEISSKDELNMLVSNKSIQKAKNSDLLLFLLDRKAGVTSLDRLLLAALRKLSIPMLLVVNKFDSHSHSEENFEYSELGFDSYIKISALHDRGIDEIFEAISNKLPTIKKAVVSKENQSAEKSPNLKILILGRPNVGKSTLINKWLNKERQITSATPGTTIDAIEEKISYFGNEIMIVDSAGIRPKMNITDDLESASVKLALHLITKADVCLILFDVSQGFSHQDSRLAQLVLEKYKSLIIVANKWDLLDKKLNTTEKYRSEFYFKRAFLQNFDIEFISALNGLRAQQLLKKSYALYQSRQKKIKASLINKFIQELNKTAKFPTRGARKLTIKYGLQVGINPPSFSFFVNDTRLVKDNFEMFIINSLTRTFGFRGTRIRVIWKEK